ncbi:MAG: UPF0175 family protein [Planctomycetes bacterium]|nr:UPF0175 family protein [Planctomycetota bacterium]MBL7044542.1 UPF0175 family protein [Pirellulaceae bacterium]
MTTINIPLESDLVSLLQSLNQPILDSARELMVLELYRRGTISSGKAAELLGISRWGFISHASRLGIPFFEMTEDEFHVEATQSSQL